ncbi:diaminopimelate epimerase [Brachybacterium hainanense]|uniref:Diaminopimelate epimerase n=1 Tax=Brachybacterium hainanense TaxID=1541174 RepID=A0ABV6REU0_9MICO
MRSARSLSPARAHGVPASLRTGEGTRFTKGHGTFNDFVLLDDPEGRLDLTPEAVRGLADRRGGIGGDGVIRVVRTRAAGVDAPAGAPEWFMDYRNADGTLAEMCGNGVRVFGAFLDRAGRMPEGAALPIWTRAGLRTLEILRRPSEDGAAWQVRVGMGPARIGGTRRTVTVRGPHQQPMDLPTLDVDLGNPHAAAMLPPEVDLEALDLESRPDLVPFPEAGTNIELVSLRGERHAAMRVFERGVGETLSCGTGTVAAAVAAAAASRDDSGLPWRIDVPGGSVVIGWESDGTTTLTGPAELVADGVLLP